MTFSIGLSLKQNCFAKPPSPNQVMPFIINNFSNILVIATNLDINTNTSIINIRGNKFYNYLAYFLIPFDPWLIQQKKLIRLIKIKITY